MGPDLDSARQAAPAAAVALRVPVSDGSVSFRRQSRTGLTAGHPLVATGARSCAGRFRRCRCGRSAVSGPSFRRSWPRPRCSTLPGWFPPRREAARRQWSTCSSTRPRAKGRSTAAHDGVLARRPVLITPIAVRTRLKPGVEGRQVAAWPAAVGGCPGHPQSRPPVCGAPSQPHVRLPMHHLPGLGLGWASEADASARFTVPLSLLPLLQKADVTDPASNLPSNGVGGCQCEDVSRPGQGHQL